MDQSSAKNDPIDRFSFFFPPLFENRTSRVAFHRREFPRCAVQKDTTRATSNLRTLAREGEDGSTGGVTGNVPYPTTKQNVYSI